MGKISMPRKRAILFLPIHCGRFKMELGVNARSHDRASQKSTRARLGLPPWEPADAGIEKGGTSE